MFHSWSIAFGLKKGRIRHSCNFHSTTAIIKGKCSDLPCSPSADVTYGSFWRKSNVRGAGPTGSALNLRLKTCFLDAFWNCHKKLGQFFEKAKKGSCTIRIRGRLIVFKKAGGAQGKRLSLFKIKPVKTCWIWRIGLCVTPKWLSRIWLF